MSEYRADRSALLCSRTIPVPRSSAVHSLWSSPVLSAVSWSYPVICQQSLVIPCTVHSLWSFPVLSAVSGHSLYCPQSLVIPCTVRSLWSFPVLSAVSGHLLYYVRSLWSSPVLCPQSLVIS
ncbi:unnamed protein product, partial [Staurois parvus]